MAEENLGFLGVVSRGLSVFYPQLRRNSNQAPVTKEAALGWCVRLTKLAASMMPSSTGWVQSKVNFRTCFFFLLPLVASFFYGSYRRDKEKLKRKRPRFRNSRAVKRRNGSLDWMGGWMKEGRKGRKGGEGRKEEGRRERADWAPLSGGPQGGESRPGSPPTHHRPLGKAPPPTGPEGPREATSGPADCLPASPRPPCPESRPRAQQAPSPISRGAGCGRGLAREGAPRPFVSGREICKVPRPAGRCFVLATAPCSPRTRTRPPRALPRPGRKRDSPRAPWRQRRPGEERQGGGSACAAWGPPTSLPSMRATPSRDARAPGGSSRRGSAPTLPACRAPRASIGRAERRRSTCREL